MEKLKAAGQWLKVNSWKYFGALIMEEKSAGDTKVMSVSFHKTLGLIMFGWCLWQWSYPEIINGAVLPLDSDAVYTLWGLLGLKGVSKIAESLAGK